MLSCGGAVRMYPFYPQTVRVPLQNKLECLAKSYVCMKMVVSLLKPCLLFRLAHFCMTRNLCYVKWSLILIQWPRCHSLLWLMCSWDFFHVLFNICTECHCFGLGMQNVRSSWHVTSYSLAKLENGFNLVCVIFI